MDYQTNKKYRRRETDGGTDAQMGKRTKRRSDRSTDKQVTVSAKHDYRR